MLSDCEDAAPAMSYWRSIIAERFREILAAYETLNDPSRRENYDRSLQNTDGPMPQVVEPLTAQARAGPMLGQRRVVYQDFTR
jgi:curved DNA-binding protein CbpA